MSNIDLRQYAAGLLGQEGFLEVMRLLKAETIKDWANTDAADALKREEHYANIQALARLETRLKSLVDDKTMDARKQAAADLRSGKVVAKPAEGTW